MKKKLVTYTQCLLCRYGFKQKSGVDSYRVGFIPTKFAQKMRKIDIKIDGKWSKGWHVESVGVTLDGVYAEVHETDYRRQRKASDI